MMAITFALLLAALVLRLLDRPRAAAVSLFLCSAFAVGLFLWEVDSPDFGFRMPWLQVELRHAGVGRV